MNVKILAWSYFGNRIACRHPCGQIKKKN